MSNPRSNTHRQSWITAHRVAVLVLLLALVAIGSILVTRPAPDVLTTAEIATAVNGPEKYQRPSAMEYVNKTGSCVVGGTVTSTQWHVGSEAYDIGEVDPNSVDYTSNVFRSDEGREFNVSANGALYSEPGDNLGLELECDPATMTTDKSFGMRAIIWGGM